VSRRRARRAGGTLKDGERRQLARASRTPAPTLGAGPDRVHCDGGSRGNPGPAAIAAVLVGADGAVIRREASRIGRATAAEAEYRAILLGLGLAADHDLARVEVRSDSQLALAGVQGEMDVADPHLAALAAEVRDATRAFAAVTWAWHPRAQNGAADELVRELLWG
jgi:ribonuclease HI